jgi:hypothetical protein
MFDDAISLLWDKPPTQSQDSRTLQTASETCYNPLLRLPIRPLNLARFEKHVPTWSCQTAPPKAQA